MANLTDGEAKAILRDSQYWPTCTAKWGVSKNGDYWIRCRPSDSVTDRRPLPILRSPGARRFKTQPDGMWAYFHGSEFVDVLAVEHCGSIQNLNDKRSRYMSIGTSLLLEAPNAWLHRELARPNGGRMPRYEACGTFTDMPLKKGKLDVPIRFLRVLFLIPDGKYADWMANSVPAGHEFFMKHRSLKTATSQDTQQFLARMSFQAHFRTRS